MLFSNEPEVFLPEYSQPSILHAAHFQRIYVVNLPYCMGVSYRQRAPPNTPVCYQYPVFSCSVYLTYSVSMSHINGGLL